MERDVSRWLKEMGYRGQGLKRENLRPLCRGEMEPVWEALMTGCRPAEVVEDMRRKVEVKTQRQAVVETRERTKEQAESRRRQIERVRDLRRQREQNRAELQRMRTELQQLVLDVAAVDEDEAKQKTAMETKLSRKKILDAFADRTEASRQSIAEETRQLQKHLRTASESLQKEAEQGMASFEAVMGQVHDSVCDHMCEKLQSRPLGELLPPEDVFPKMVANADGTDSATSQLFTGIGRLYAHYAQQLTYFFKTACEDARFVASQYEAKHAERIKRMDQPQDQCQLKAVEELRFAHVKAFLSQEEMEESGQRRMRSLKDSSEVQKFLRAVEKAGCQEAFNGRLDALCLEREIETLEGELRRLEGDRSRSRAVEETAKSLYRKLKDRAQQSEQTDLLLLYCTRRLRSLQQDFEEVAASVKEKLEKDLPSAVQSCIEELRFCRDEIEAEIKSFNSFDLRGRTKSSSLKEDVGSDQLRLLQRCDIAMDVSLGPDTAPYQTASLQQFGAEMKQVLPIARMDAIDGLFCRLSQSLQASLQSGFFFQAATDTETLLAEDLRIAEAQDRELKEKHVGKEREAKEAASEMDDLAARGHDTLRSLRGEVADAQTALEDEPGFLSTPWEKCDGKGVAEWVASLHGQPSAAL